MSIFLGNANLSEPNSTVYDTIDDRFLVGERIPIDLAVLCNIIERLFGLAIMTVKSRGSLHGVILPQSWLLALWTDFMTFRGRTLAPLWVLAQATETLLKDIYTGEYLRLSIEFNHSGAFVHSRRDRPLIINLVGHLDRKNKVLNWSRSLPQKYVQDLSIARMLVYLF